MSTETGAMPARVLVVDDNRDAADSLAMLLGIWGHLASVAYGGASALAKARDWRFDVAILDVGLPGIHGSTWHEPFAPTRR